MEQIVPAGSAPVPADLALDCATLLEAHPLHRDGADVPSLENGAGKNITPANSPIHIRTPSSVFRIHRLVT